MNLFRSIFKDLVETIVEVGKDLWLQVKILALFFAVFAVLRVTTGITNTYRVALLTTAICLAGAAAWAWFVRWNTLTDADDALDEIGDSGFALRWSTIAFFVVAPVCVFLFTWTAPDPPSKPPNDAPAARSTPETETERKHREAGARILSEIMKRRAEERRPPQPMAEPGQQGPEPE